MGLLGGGEGLFYGVDGEGDGPETIIVSAFGVVEQDLTGLPELVSLYVESHL
jgi:hypothetical protein